MPDKVTLRDPRPTRTVELPSFPGSKVEIWPSLLARDMILFDPEAPPAKQGMAALPSYIKSWNLAGEDGVDLPVNGETVGRLPVDDIVFLFSEISKIQSEQKKS
jgi:hypothetical protein